MYIHKYNNLINKLWLFDFLLRQRHHTISHEVSAPLPPEHNMQISSLYYIKVFNGQSAHRKIFIRKIFKYIYIYKDIFCTCVARYLCLLNDDLHKTTLVGLKTCANLCG